MGRATYKDFFGRSTGFYEPISGSIALGYGSYFGLGLFVPEATNPGGSP